MPCVENRLKLEFGGEKEEVARGTLCTNLLDARSVNNKRRRIGSAACLVLPKYGAVTRIPENRRKDFNPLRNNGLKNETAASG